MIPKRATVIIVLDFGVKDPCSQERYLSRSETERERHETFKTARIICTEFISIHSSNA